MTERHAGRRSPLPIIFCMAVVVIVIAFAGYIYNSHSTNDAVMDGKEYFGISDGEAALIVNDTILDKKGVIQDGTIYLSYDTVRSYFNSGFYWESSSSQMLLTLPAGTSTWTADDGSKSLVMIDGTPYLSAQCVQENSDIDMEILQDPDRIVARTSWSSLTAKKVTEAADIRYSASLKSRKLTSVAAGDLVILTEAGKNWSKVSTENGYQGYIRTSLLKDAGKDAVSHTSDDRFVFEHKMVDGKINLGFQYVNDGSNDAGTMQTLVANTSGLTALAPTFFNFSNASGDLTSYATAEYVQAAHDLGLQVYGALNDIEGDASDLGTILESTSVRTHIIDQLLQIASDTGMDGINIDLETVTEDTAPQYLQFLKELCVAAHAQNLIVSADAYVPGYTEYLNRKEQAKTVDYIVIMGYDEHTDYTDELGSVASISYVKQGITDTLKEVPEDQVINAIPFYTRGWTQAFGGESFSSETLGMDGADTFVKDHGIQLTWDSDAGQNTGSAEDGTAKYSIWMEDEQSIEEKMKLVQKYDLAGVAEWRLGYERSDVWEIITKYLN